jgi:alpha-beta hydrolase superfamily lysophospholipase
MKTFSSEWAGDDHISFFMQGWEPGEKPKAIVALIHGLGEHSGRYAHVGLALAEADYAMAGFDLRGHGRSGGARGHVSSLNAYLQDIRQFLDLISKRYPGLPRFLYGHSLGGLLALAYGIQYGSALKGMIVTGPALRSSLQQQKVKVAVAKWLGSLVPSLTVSSGLDPKTISRDPNVVNAYVSDSLVHDRASLGFGKVALQAIDLCLARAKELAPPLLIMHGAADTVTYSSGSEEFARLVREAGGDVTSKLWEGLYHELHNEPEKAEVFQFMIEWLEEHLN